MKNRTLLPTAMVAAFAQSVSIIQDQPTARTVKSLETHAGFVGTMLMTGGDVKNLKPYIDAIDQKIESVGAGTAKWATQFSELVQDVTASQEDGADHQTGRGEDIPAGGFMAEVPREPAIATTSN